MKYRAILLALLSALCMMNCARKEATPVLSWEVRNVRQVYCPENTDQQACTTVDLTFPFFTGKPLMADSLNTYILGKLCFKLNDETLCQNVQAIAENFIEHYKLFLADMPDYQHGWELQQTISVIRDTLDILSLQHDAYAYTGGAHGMSSTLYYNLDRESGKPIALFDLIKPEEKKSLLIVTEQLFRRQRNIALDQSLEQAGYWFEKNSFSLPDNFTVTQMGLLFLYNPYEIASYADGKIELFVPFSDIQAMLKKSR